MTGGRVVVLGPTGRNFAAGMSGGVAYVLDEDGEFPARCNMGMVGFEELSEADAIELRAMIEEHAERTGQPGRGSACWRAGSELLAAKRLREGDAARLQARAARTGRGRGRGRRHRRQSARDRRARRWRAAAGRGRRRGGRLMGELGRLPEDRAPRRPLPGQRRARARLPRVPAPAARSPELREQGARCMDCGVPFCHNGCPLGNLIPDWNDLVYRDRFARRDPPAARDQQLPRVHRPAVPGAVRGLVRARDPRGRRGHDQTDRERDHQPRLGGGLGRAPAAAPRERPLGGRRRLRPGRDGGRPAAAPRRPRA